MRFDGKKPIEFSDDTVKLEQENLEETKYVLRGDAPSTDSSVKDDEGLLDVPEDGEDLGGLEDMGGELELDDKPFDDEPFDAGIEADEDTDPQKYIQQLSGKLGQSLRQYSEDEGQPDFDLEKFAVNSVLSATHTGEMDTEDQRDIINKVKGSGKEDPEDSEDSEDPEDMDDEDNPNNSSMDDGSNNNGDVNFGAEAPMENSMLGSSLQESKKNSTFIDKNDIMEAAEPLVEPVIKPTVKPRRERELDRPFLPKRRDKVNPEPKAGEAIHEVGGDENIEFNGRTVLSDSIEIDGINYNDWPNFSDAFITSATYEDGTSLDDIELSTLQDENDMLVNQMIFDKQLYL